MSYIYFTQDMDKEKLIKDIKTSFKIKIPGMDK